MVWPVENYTDHIHKAVKLTMATYSHLSFTLNQLHPYLAHGLTWLRNPNEQQAALLNKIITTGLAKLIQLGQVKRVSSRVSVEPQWQWASQVASSGYTNITSEDAVAHTDEAKAAVGRRAIGGQSLWRLNQPIRNLGKA